MLSDFNASEDEGVMINIVAHIPEPGWEILGCSELRETLFIIIQCEADILWSVSAICQTNSETAPHQDWTTTR